MTIPGSNLGSGACYTMPSLFSATHTGGERCVTQANCQPAFRCDFYTRIDDEYCCTTCVHPGEDIGCNYENMYSPVDATVILADRLAGYYRPNYLVLQATVGPFAGCQLIFGHMWTIASTIQTGGTVRRGQLLGQSGEQTICAQKDEYGTCLSATMTPDGTGPHVHFELRKLVGQGACADGKTSSGWLSWDPWEMLSLANANGGPTPDPEPPPDPVVTTSRYGDIAKAISTINVRATPAGTVIGSMSTGALGEILSEAPITASLSGTSYAWVFVNMLGKTLKGWVAVANLALSRQNRLINGHFQSSGITGVSGYNGGTHSRAVSASRNLVATGGGTTAYTDWWLTVTCDGTKEYQGAYLRSLDINSDGFYRYAWGHISVRNISASDFIKYVGIRLIYSSGPPTDKWHPAQLSGSAEQRISIPEFAIDPNRRLMRAQFYTFAGPGTGNPRSWEINRAIVYLRR